MHQNRGRLPAFEGLGGGAEVLWKAVQQLGLASNGNFSP